MRGAHVYVDSSVLVAAFATEDARHRRVNAWLLEIRDRLATSALSEVEMLRALAKRAASPVVVSRAIELLAEVWLLDITASIREAAVAVRPSVVRSLDAIHVASAVVAEAREFATLDRRQSVAAEEMGLTLVSLP